MGEIGQSLVVLDELRADAPNQQRIYRKPLEECHGWIHVWSWLDRFWGVCACGYLSDGPGGLGFRTYDAALEATCPRREGQQVSVAHVES